MTKESINKAQGILRIGTSGIALPVSKQHFPEAYRSSSRLSYYGSLFNTLEINSSFYKIPMPATFRRWANEVPEDFTFTVKLWKEITHTKKRSVERADIDAFMEAADHLGEKKACILIQFPSSIRPEYLDKVEEILQKLGDSISGTSWRPAIEFRHTSWYTDETYAMLDRYKAALVFQDIAASGTPEKNPATPFVYMRFHGPNGDYRGSYDDSFLKLYSDRIRSYLDRGTDVYVYFNNTMGDAFQNAQRLRELIQNTPHDYHT